jgi:hypothetical protein
LSARERILTKEQKDRIATAEKELNDTIVAHEQMRGLLCSDEWRQQASPPNGPSMSGDTRTLQRDIVRYGVDVLTVLAQASLFRGTVESLRSHLETDAREIVARVRAKVNPRDLLFLDTDAFERALNRVVSDWVAKAQREFPPSWEIRAQTEVPTRMSEYPGSGSAEPGQPSAPNVSRDDAIARPLVTEDPTAATADDENDGEGQLPSQLLQLKAPVFKYNYPDDFPDAEQLAIEAARLKANRQLESKGVRTYGEYRGARKEWFWHVVSAAATAIGQAGAGRGWGANRRRETLRDFGLNAAQAVRIAGPYSRNFHSLCESAKWQALDDRLLTSCITVKTGHSKVPPDPGSPSESGRMPEEIDDPRFRRGVQENPYLYAHWDALQSLWTLHDWPTGGEGKPDSCNPIPADPESTRFIKEAARIAVSRLRQSHDPEIRALAITLRERLNVWLDLMRTKERGFRRIPQLTSWRGGESEVFMESGTVPSDARLTENGAIHRLFFGSAAFWDDLVAVGFDSEVPPTVEWPPNAKVPSTPEPEATSEFEQIGPPAFVANAAVHRRVAEGKREDVIGHIEPPAGAPEDRLSRFRQEHPGATLADVKYSANVHTAEFQDWRRGKLKPDSVMSERIEKVLAGIAPLKKKPPKPRLE